VFRLGLATEEDSIFPNNLPPNSLIQIFCVSELSYNQPTSTGIGF